MNKSQFNFIIDVADYVYAYSQFSDDVCYYIGCLFALESSYGTSSLAKERNNFCGMKNPMVRITTSICAGNSKLSNPWAKYVGLECCVIDFLLCLQAHHPNSRVYDSVDYFARFVSKFYCTEPDYISKINSIYSQFKNYKNER